MTTPNTSGLQPRGGGLGGSRSGGTVTGGNLTRTPVPEKAARPRDQFSSCIRGRRVQL